MSVSTEKDLEGYALGLLKSAEQAVKRREARWEDIDFLLSCGYSPQIIATRLDVSANALARQAYRQLEKADDEEAAELWSERARHFNYNRRAAT